tara:strand:+ start:1743 stop:1982 length:240 start_codon:yes stop_codon:yes gene_type:complete
MTNEEIKIFFKKIKNLNLSKYQKERMMKFVQIRDVKRKNSVMTFKNFVKVLREKNGKITSLVLGPDFNRIIFASIDIEV